MSAKILQIWLTLRVHSHLHFQWWRFLRTFPSESKSLRRAYCLCLCLKWMHRQKEKCVLKQMCAYKTKNCIVKKFTHKFFTSFHPYQSNDNVNTKQTLFKRRASGFCLVKSFSASLTIENDILGKVKFCNQSMINF